MADGFLGELKLVSFGFAPKGWAQCNGQLLAINQNQALFALLGTTYGGNGQTTFALPDLRGRTPIGFGNLSPQGEKAGEENHTLVINEVPAHTHQLTATTDAANSIKPGAHVLATTSGNLTIYASNVSNLTPMAPSIPAIGGSQPHPNQQPFLVMNWIILLQGIFPSRN
jgi:microcystin-dependent protein